MYILSREVFCFFKLNLYIDFFQYHMRGDYFLDKKSRKMIIIIFEIVYLYVFFVTNVYLKHDIIGLDRVYNTLVIYQF